MSGLDHKRTFCDAEAMSALPPIATKKADIAGLDGGRALLLCPIRSDVDLLRYGECIVHINAEIPDGALFLV